MAILVTAVESRQDLIPVFGQGDIEIDVAHDQQRDTWLSGMTIRRVIHLTLTLTIEDQVHTEWDGGPYSTKTFRSLRISPNPTNQDLRGISELEVRNDHQLPSYPMATF